MEKISIEELMDDYSEIDRNSEEEKGSFDTLHKAMEKIAADNLEFKVQLEREFECLCAFGWTRYEYYEELLKRDMEF